MNDWPLMKIFLFGSRVMKLGKNAPRGLIILTKFRDYREKIMTFLLIPIPNFGIVAFFLVHTLGLSMTIGKEMTRTKVLKRTSLVFY